MEGRSRGEGVAVMGAFAERNYRSTNYGGVPNGNPISQIPLFTRVRRPPRWSRA